MRVVVVGAGRVGLSVIGQGLAVKDDVIVIERDSDRATRAHRMYPEARIVRGDATSEAVLLDALAEPPDAVIAATRQDPTNLLVATLARQLGVRVVAALATEEAEPLFVEVGATPVPRAASLTAEKLYRAFTVPGLQAFMPVGADAEVVTLVLEPTSGLSGKRVRDASFAGDALLVAVNRAGEVIVPSGDLTLEAGDVLTLVARKRRLQALVDSVLGAGTLRLPRRVRRR